MLVLPNVASGAPVAVSRRTYPPVPPVSTVLAPMTIVPSDWRAIPATISPDGSAS